MSALQKFHSRIDKNGECWVWTGGHSACGYGCFKPADKQVLAHRYSYEQHVGPIPTGHFVLHRCDNKSCVNPAHLFTGTQRDNMQDMKAKGRHQYGERSSRAKLTEAQAREILLSTELPSVAAKRFNISHMTVRHIRKGRLWAHLQQEYRPR